jgi:hypothetical protein
MQRWERAATAIKTPSTPADAQTHIHTRMIHIVKFCIMYPERLDIYKQVLSNRVILGH